MIEKYTEPRAQITRAREGNKRNTAVATVSSWEVGG